MDGTKRPLTDGADALVPQEFMPINSGKQTGRRYGSQGDYEPEQEWQSTDGGATFSLVNGGKSVANGIINASTALSTRGIEASARSLTVVPL